jgi:calcineurin-like phosphoesterase
MDKEEPIRRFLTRVPSGRFEASTGPGTLAGLAIEIDDDTGLARAVAPVRLGGVLEEAVPSFWASE